MLLCSWLMVPGSVVMLMGLFVYGSTRRDYQLLLMRNVIPMFSRICQRLHLQRWLLWHTDMKNSMVQNWLHSDGLYLSKNALQSIKLLYAGLEYGINYFTNFGPLFQTSEMKVVTATHPVLDVIEYQSFANPAKNWYIQEIQTIHFDTLLTETSGKFYRWPLFQLNTWVLLNYIYFRSKTW